MKFKELFEEYIKEREDCNLYQIDDGYITVRMDAIDRYGRIMFINDFFVSHKSRKKSKHTAVKLLEKAREVANKLECKEIRAVVYTKAKNSTESLKACLYYGFKVVGAENDKIFILMDLSEKVHYPLRLKNKEIDNGKSHTDGKRDGRSKGKVKES